MPLVTYKDLCIDALDVSAMEGFWARTLGLKSEILDEGDSVLRGAEPSKTVWINLVPEARTVKHRVHIDVNATSLEPLAGLEQRSKDEEFPWTIFADPEGGEFCVFVREKVGDYLLYEVCVDAADHASTSAWWADVMGGTHGQDKDHDFSWIEKMPGVPFDGFSFANVPEPKTVKNRIHWDVTLNEGVTVDDLVAAGATVLRTQDDEISWTIMADPEGNEFCVFARE